MTEGIELPVVEANVQGVVGGDLSRRSASSQPRRREIPLVIRRDGVWLYHGSPVERKEMVCLFSSLLNRDKSGDFYLRSSTEMGYVQVEDAPFLAVELAFEGTCCKHQTLSLRINTDEVFVVSAQHPLTADWQKASADEGVTVPYLFVRAGEGNHPISAKVTRAVYYELMSLAVVSRANGDECIGVWSQGAFFPLARKPVE